jgi:hypothetical protein
VSLSPHDQWTLVEEGVVQLGENSYSLDCVRAAEAFFDTLGESATWYVAGKGQPLILEGTSLSLAVSARVDEEAE